MARSSGSIRDGGSCDQAACGWRATQVWPPARGRAGVAVASCDSRIGGA